jgi:hypothetical protein
MVTDGVHLSAAFQPAPPDRLSPGERWHWPGPALWAHHRRRLLGVSARDRRSDGARTAPRLVPRWRPHKWGQRGHQRRRLEVSAGLAPVRRWVGAWSAPTCRPLARALDASTVGPRFAVLRSSGVLRGGALPVAWRGVAATRPGAWRPPWAALLGPWQGRVPADWPGRVWAERGLYAPGGCTTRPAVGWPPCLRLKRPGPYRPQASAALRPLTQVVRPLGQRWAGPVGGLPPPARPLPWTLLAQWDAGYREPWVVLTAVPATGTAVAWYGRRAWSEGGGTASQRGGRPWEQSTRTPPARAERLGRARARAPLWTGSGGWQAAVPPPRPALTRFPAPPIARRRAARVAPGRPRSGCRRGPLVSVAARCRGQALPMGSVGPEPWPQRGPAPDAPSIGQPQRPKAA